MKGRRGAASFGFYIGAMSGTCVIAGNNLPHPYGEAVVVTLVLGTIAAAAVLFAANFPE